MNIKILNNNTLKIIAAISMLIDHIGVILFPKVLILRIIGRIAFPIFAFLIAEGTRYTKNKVRHLLTIASFAAICQIGLLIVNIKRMCILVTFTISIILIYTMQKFKHEMFSKNAKSGGKVMWGLLFLCGVVLTYILNRYATIEYGFIGCITPVFASIFDFRGIDGAPSALKKLDNTTFRSLSLAIPLAYMAFRSAVTVQAFAFAAFVFLLAYSGKRGRLNMKYFFYIFYPAHFVILYGISFII